jgi:hypothetical protein
MYIFKRRNYLIMEVEYTVSTGMKVFYGAIAVFMAGFALFLFNIGHPHTGPAILLFPAFILLFAVVIVISQLKRKIILSADLIVKVDIFGRKELPTANVKGCRIGEKAIFIESDSPSYPKITINNYSDLGSSDELKSWLIENFKDLDALDLKQTEDQLLHDTSLGFTEQEREEKLKRAQLTARIYNIGGGVLGATSFFIDHYLIIVALLLYPVAGIVILRLNNGLIKFLSNKKRSPYPFIFLGFYFCALMLLIKSIVPYDVFQYDHIWPVAFCVGIAITALLYFTGLNKSAEAAKGQVIFMLIMGMLYGYGSTLEVNCAFDKSTAQIFTAQVLDHRVTRGKSNTYYLSLSPWGPRTDAEEVSVPRWLYNEVPVGQTVKIKFKTGLLNIPWFVVTD